MKDAECIFCKIVAGDIPSTRVYEDDTVLAFMDINPAMRGHCLVISKAHYATLPDVPNDVLGGVITAAKTVGTAVVKALRAEGLNLIQSNGAVAGQIIDHFHMHVMPRWGGDKVDVANWEMKQGDMDDIAAAAAMIREQL